MAKQAPPDWSGYTDWLRKQAGVAPGAAFDRYPQTRGGDEYENITRRIALAGRNQLPNYMQPLISSIFPYEQQVFRTQRNLQPQYAQLETDIYRNQAPQLEQVNFDIFRNLYPQYAGIQGAVDLGLLRGVGRDTALENLALQKEIDPQFFQAREAAMGPLLETLRKSQALIGGMDPNKLTGAELENVARGLNRVRGQTGDLTNPSNQGAISSALTFGDELSKKRSGVSAAIANVMGAIQGTGQFGQMSRSGINPMESVARATGGASGQFGQGIGQLGANKTVQRQPIGQGANYASSFFQLPADLYMLERQLDKTGNWDLGQTAANKLIPNINLGVGFGGGAR